VVALGTANAAGSIVEHQTEHLNPAPQERTLQTRPASGTATSTPC
jgi:hypothetical protein